MPATKRRTTKVMVFGVFDFLHKGHLNFLKQAKHVGDELIVSVARDANVFEAKGHLPVFGEKERVAKIAALPFIDKAVLGGTNNPWTHILKEKPDILALGYDQGPYLAASPQALQKELRKRGLAAKVVRLKSFVPIKYKTNKLRVVSEVVRGHRGRGKSLGFPTANLKVSADIPQGIYVSWAHMENKRLPSLTFIGAAKTFNETKIQAEVFILDFKEVLYGKRIKVELLRKIRDNKKFRSSKELVRQMKKDEKFARKFFGV